jgi:hypothetical protein
MKRKLLINLTCLALLCIAGTSCNKYLDLQPQDGIIRQEFWKTKEQVQSAVIGCYASLLASPTNNRPLSETMFLWGELRADMIAPGIGIAADENDVINVNTLATNTVTNWAGVYQVINYCNTVIDFAPSVLANDNTFTQQQLNQFLAEARALRAMMYFTLVKSFRDVPLKLKSTSSDTDLQQLPKTSGDSVLTQVLADLKFADSNAVITYGNTITDKGRINKFTVKALLADVYLWMENYAECEAACNYIIDSRKYGLIAGNGGWFNNLYYIGNSNEGIFEFQFDQQKLNSFYNIFLTSRQRFLASPLVMEQIYTVDFLDDNNKDIRGEGASVRTSDNAIWKYVAVDYNTLRAQDQSYAHWFAYRYADILLMKAEAINQMGGRGTEALDLVNIIRTRARALAATNTNPDPADRNGVADFILAERAREFAFEGKRWYDILRNSKRNNYERLDILLNMVAKAVPANRQISAINKYKDPNRNSHYFPIFFYEIQSNPNLVQNPFYQ